MWSFGGVFLVPIVMTGLLLISEEDGVFIDEHPINKLHNKLQINILICLIYILLET